MLDPPDPSTIVATIPRWIGRRPICGETVLVGFSPNDDDHAVCLTLPPDREPGDEVAAMRQLVVDGAEQVAIVALTGSESPQHEEHLQFLATAVELYGLEVLGVLVAIPPQRDRLGYWRSLPDPARLPLPPSYTRTEENT